jgi:hypothetical protein
MPLFKGFAYLNDMPLIILGDELPIDTTEPGAGKWNCFVAGKRGKGLQ